MSKLFDEALEIAKKENKTATDYKRLKEISRQIPESEDYEMAWILEGLFQEIPGCSTCKSYGKYIRIRHNGNYKTAYAHLMKTKKRKFQKVSQGDVIGYVGSTGRSTGPHLHYEVLFAGRQVNPMRIKLPSGKNVPKGDLSRYKKHVLNIKNKIYVATLSSKDSNSLAFSTIIIKIS